MKMGSAVSSRSEFRGSRSVVFFKGFSFFLYDTIFGKYELNLLQFSYEMSFKNEASYDLNILS